MSKKLQKCLFFLAVSSMVLRGGTSCIPSRSQINGLINSSLLNGIGLVIELSILNALGPKTTAT